MQGKTKAATGRIKTKRGVVRESAYTARISKEVLTDNQVVAVPIPSEEEIATVLRRARELVRRGWCRGFAAVDVDGRPSHISGAGEMVAFSLPAAVRAGSGGRLVDRLAAEYAIRSLRRLVGHHNLAEWNDHPLRTKRDVLELLAQAVQQHGGPRLRRGGWVVGGAR